MSGNNIYCPYCRGHHHTVEHYACRKRALEAMPKLDRCKCGGSATVHLEEREPRHVYPDGSVIYDRVIKCNICEYKYTFRNCYYSIDTALERAADRWNSEDYCDMGVE